MNRQTGSDTEEDMQTYKHNYTGRIGDGCRQTEIHVHACVDKVPLRKRQANRQANRQRQILQAGD